MKNYGLIPIIKMANIKYPIIKIDTKKAIYCLRRPYYKSIYYNSKCNYDLQPQEIQHINSLLSYMYGNYLENKNNPKWRGANIEKLADAFMHKSERAKTRQILASKVVSKLIPQFVNVRTLGYNKAKVCRLNDAGLLLVELLIKDAQNGGYVKDKDNNVEEKNGNNNTDDEEESDDNEVEEYV